MPFIAARGAEAYRALSPDSETAGSKLVCFNERFARPDGLRGPVRDCRCASSARSVAGGLRDGARDQGACRSAARSAGILPASQLDTPFDFDALAAEGCMVGHGEHPRPSTTQTDMRELASHLLRFGAHESCGKCFPCRIGLRRAHDMFAADAPVDRERFEQLLEALELGSLCAHGERHAGAAAQPAGPLPRRAGAGMMQVTVDGAAVEVAAGATILEAARAAGAWVPTLCYDERQAPFGACRVCLVGVGGRAEAAAACTTPCRDGMEIDTARRDRAPGGDRGRRAGAVRAARGAGAAHRAGRDRRAPRRRRTPRWPGRDARASSTTCATPTSPSSTSCASPAGAACARATRSRGRSP